MMQTKELLKHGGKYGFWDFFRIPFMVCPLYAGIKTLNQVGGGCHRGNVGSFVLACHPERETDL